MESLINFIISHASHAHWIVFFTMLIAGFNIPISEDLIIIMSAFLASNIVPENATKLFLCLFIGCYLSDWITYSMGRFLGPKLWKISWFKKTFPEKRLNIIHSFYKKYGGFTLLVGRFIPFGVRNCLFLSAGLGKMNFFKFIAFDGIACALSNSILFIIVYKLGQNYSSVFIFLKAMNVLIFVIFAIILAFVIVYYRKRKNAKKAN